MLERPAGRSKGPSACEAVVNHTVYTNARCRPINILETRLLPRAYCIICWYRVAPGITGFCSTNKSRSPTRFQRIPPPPTLWCNTTLARRTMSNRRGCAITPSAPGIARPGPTSRCSPHLRSEPWHPRRACTVSRTSGASPAPPPPPTSPRRRTLAGRRGSGDNGTSPSRSRRKTEPRQGRLADGRRTAPRSRVGSRWSVHPPPPSSRGLLWCLWANGLKRSIVSLRISMVTMPCV